MHVDVLYHQPERLLFTVTSFFVYRINSFYLFLVLNINSPENCLEHESELPKRSRPIAVSQSVTRADVYRLAYSAARVGPTALKNLNSLWRRRWNIEETVELELSSVFLVFNLFIILFLDDQPVRHWRVKRFAIVTVKQLINDEIV